MPMRFAPSTFLRLELESGEVRVVFVGEKLVEF